MYSNWHLPWVRHGALALLLLVSLPHCATTSPMVMNSVKHGESSSAVEDSQTTSTAELHGRTEPDSLNQPQNGSSAGSAQEPQQTVPLEFPPYAIGPGDVLSFRILEDEDLNTEVTVRYDGYVSLPWIPDVKIGEQTSESAVELLKEAYLKVYKDPNISLDIVTPAGKKYTVLGDVERPSEYTYTRPISIMDAITEAGGMRIDQRAGDSFVSAQGQLVKAYLIRHVQGRREVTEYDLRGLQHSGPHAGDAAVLPGDVVYVPEGVNLVYILGEALRPDVVAMQEDTTLLQILAAVGSFNPSTARLRKVVLMRETSENETKIMIVNVRTLLKTGEDMLLFPGDIIYIPRKRLVNLADFVSRFTGSISPILSLYTQAANLDQFGGGGIGINRTR